MAENQAFVTLATNDTYVKGALVLGSSLRQHKTTRKLVVLITPHVSDSMSKVLEQVFDDVRMVNVLDSQDSANLALMQRPELGITLTKIHCWKLTEYTKCVFMDADTMVLCNIDELFERDELSAAPDPGWPDCFNSGVFVYKPSTETYNQLLQFATEKGSFDGGDQGLLNSFFSNWATKEIHKHLPFLYNLSSISIYSYLPAFKAFGNDAKVVHFLGKVKPWNYTYDCVTKAVRSEVHDQSIHPEFLNLWWDIYATRILPLLTEEGVIKEASTTLQATSSVSLRMELFPEKESTLHREHSSQLKSPTESSLQKEPSIAPAQEETKSPYSSENEAKTIIAYDKPALEKNEQCGVCLKDRAIDSLAIPPKAEERPTFLKKEDKIPHQEREILAIPPQEEEMLSICTVEERLAITKAEERLAFPQMEETPPVPSQTEERLAVSPEEGESLAISQGERPAIPSQEEPVPPKEEDRLPVPPKEEEKPMESLTVAAPEVMKEPSEEEVTEELSHLAIAPPPQLSSQERKERWEQGQIDYMGEDSYDNIRKKLDSYLK